MGETSHIYIAPNIRTQKLEEAEQFIELKRVKRMIMANKYRETMLMKAEKLETKAAIRFEKQAIMFDNAMSKLQEQIERLDTRLMKLSEIHGEMVNIEKVINDEKA